MKEADNKGSEEVKAEAVSAGGRKWGRRLKRILLVVMISAVIVAAAGYLSRNWLITKTEKVVVVALAEQGVHIDYEKSTRMPLRGMVFKNLAIYSSEKKQEPLLVISDIAIFPSLGRWLIEREISVKVTLNNSDISMLAKGEQVGKIENVSARIKAGISEVKVKRFSALMNGVNYELNGKVKFGKDAEQGNAEEVDKVIDEMKKGPLIDFAFWQELEQWIGVESKGGQVKIRSEFDIDTGNLDAMTVRAKFSGAAFTWHGLSFDQLRAQVDYTAENQRLEVTELDALSAEGKASGDFSYHFASKVLEVASLDSNTDVLSLINDYLGEEVVNEKVFDMVKSPHLGVSGTLDFSDLRKSDLKAEFLPTEEVSMKLNGELISMKELRGAVVFSDGKVSVQPAEVFAKMNGGEFHLAGYLQLISEDSSQGNPMSADFTLAGKSITWHGLVLEHAKAKVVFSGQDQSVIFKDLDVAYRGESLGGEVRYRIADKTIEMIKLDSQINFLQLINDVSGGELSEKGADLEMIQSPHVEVNGLVNFGDLVKSDVSVKLLDERDVIIEAGGRRIEMKALAGEVTFASGSVSTQDTGLVMNIFDGSVVLHAKVGVLAEAKAYQAKLKLKDVSLDELNQLVVQSGSGEGNKKENETARKPLQGRLFFDFEGSGDKDTPVRNAKGMMKIDGAQFYEMPLFGPFFDTVKAVIPTLAASKAKEKAASGSQTLSGTYQVTDAVVTTDDLRVGGLLSELAAEIKYDIRKDDAVIDGKIKFTGARGVITGLVSNLLEIEGTGQLRKLEWKLKNFNANGLVELGTKGAIESSKGVIKLGEDSVKGVVDMTTKGVEGMSEGLKKVLPFTKKKQTEAPAAPKPAQSEQPVKSESAQTEKSPKSVEPENKKP